MESLKIRLLNRTSLLVGACTLLWLVAIAAGLCSLWSYANVPGVAATPPVLWPADSLIKPALDRATLVIAVHPHCPCSRATIGELALIMARCPDQLTARVLFLNPGGFPSEWVKTDLWYSAAGIPGVEVIEDDGAEVSRFAAATSGETILYDAGRHLLFHGGITASRGHAGDNPGREAIVSLVTTKGSDQTQSFVFGCPLGGAESECPKGSDLCNK